MISERLKAEQKKYYRLLDQAEKSYDKKPSEDTLNKLVLINRILAVVCDKIADEHHKLMDDAVFPEDKAHHLAHILGYDDLGDKHEEAADDFANLIARGDVERGLDELSDVLASI